MRGHKLLVSRLEEIVHTSELAFVPRRWQILGELILVHIPPEIEHLKFELGQELLELYPRCKSVIWDKGVEGKYRKPNIEVIAGSGTKTIHKENGCKFAIDVSHLMFSAGNFAERMKMSTLGFSEDVLDMFSGIGQFSIPMAVHSKPKSITALEINHDAFGYLKANILLNNADSLVHPLLGDCAKLSPIDAVDRVIMGNFEAYQYLETGIQALRRGGTLHYHETVPLKLIHSRPASCVKRAAQNLGRCADLLATRKVKSYSPGIWHVVLDVKIN